MQKQSGRSNFTSLSAGSAPLRGGPLSLAKDDIGKRSAPAASTAARRLSRRGTPDLLSRCMVLHFAQADFRSTTCREFPSCMKDNAGTEHTIASSASNCLTILGVCSTFAQIAEFCAVQLQANRTEADPTQRMFRGKKMLSQEVWSRPAPTSFNNSTQVRIQCALCKP